MKLKGKSALITGAASGIGKSIAEAFAMAGARVAIADVNLSAAKAVAERINSSGGTAHFIEMDVTNEEQVNAGIEEAVLEFRGVGSASEQRRGPDYSPDHRFLIF